MKITTAYLIKFVVILNIAVALCGCGKKEEKPAPEKAKTPKTPDMIEYKLTDGKTIKVDANLFGVKYLPTGSIFSYTYISDVRHLVDKMGTPFVQPVYKHELLMETREDIDSLIKFFFPKTPHVANRRKRGLEDMYVRLVSTRDMDSIRTLDEPYVVIDMRVVYPPRQQTSRSQPEDRMANTGVTASLDDQISALRNNLERLNSRIAQDDVEIPERRRLQIQISMLEKQLSSLTEKRDALTATPDTSAQDTATVAPADNPDKKVKIKIVSFNIREEDKKK
ncbi:MAG: hypothetical protein RBU23_02885 [Candidatus Auribacterota bacterium]|nr:hypothetical protein [Candidatus Auribacterota bacterium]